MVGLAAFSAARSVMVLGWEARPLDLPLADDFPSGFSDAAEGADGLAGRVAGDRQPAMVA